MVLKCFNRSIPINLLEDGKKIKNGAHLFIFLTSPCCITVGRKETEPPWNINVYIQHI